MNRSFLIVLFIILFSKINFSQNAQEQFGKNKVQYNKDQEDWWIYETTNIVYYWYGKSRKVAEFFINIAESENKKIREIFEYHLKDKLELVIYSDLSDLHQTNLDVDLYLTPTNWNEEPRVIDQKILLYFNGNHQDALKLIRKGLIKVYFNSIFSGSQIEEAVQKVISLKLPDWFEKGLLEYLSESWTEKDLYDLKTSDRIFRKKTSFRNLTTQQTSLAGKSMWNYIVLTYGQQSISNWLYMTRIQKDVNQAAKLVFQRNLKTIYQEWKSFYQRELNKVQITNKKLSKIHLKKEEEINASSYSQLFNTFILNTNQNGRKRIRILDLKTGKAKTIFHSGHRNKITIPEIHYPLFAETKNNYFIIDQIKNKNILNKYNSSGKLLEKSSLPDEITEVFDLECYNDKILFLIVQQNGLTDLIKYNIIGRSSEKLTDNIFDELKIKYNGTNDILLLSSKPDSLPEIKTLDSIVPIYPSHLYIYHLDSKQKTFLESGISGGSIEDFNQFDQFRVYKGNINFEDLFYYKLKEEKFEFSDHLLYKVVPANENRYLKIFKKLNSQYYFSLERMKEDQSDYPLIRVNKISDSTSSSIKDSSTILPISSTQFESRFEDPDNINEILIDFYRKASPFKISDLKNVENKYIWSSPSIKFNPSQSIAYRYRFSMEEWKTSFNNDLLFGGLNTYSALDPTYSPPRAGILFKTKIHENFENYNLEFGIRVPTSFNGSEAYIIYNNLKKRWDHSFAIYRKSDKKNIPIKLNLDYQSVTKTFLFNHVAKYPFDQYKSIRINSTIRNDHTFLKSSDRISIDSNGFNIQSLGCRLEYVFDDILNLSVNLKQGTQFKIFFEANKRFKSVINNGIDIQGLPGFLFIGGIDARHHIPVLKHSVFANRFYLNSSFGSQRLLNNLGGTENWLLFTKVNSDAPLDPNSNYSFSQLVTEVRGHPIGARKGSSAALLSSELRIPFFQYLLNQNWKNSFLRNLQLIGFTDIGISWNGFIPNLNEVEKYRINAENPAVKINVIYNRNPFIAGTGIGLRTALSGYFLRLDYAWPIIQFKLSEPILHLSLGLDF